MKNLLPIFFLIFTLYACNEGADSVIEIADEADEVYYSKQMSGTPAPPPPAPEIIDVKEATINVENATNQDTNKTEKKIIKDGRIGFEVQHLEPTKQRIDSLVEATGSYYANDRFDESPYESTFSLKI